MVRDTGAGRKSGPYKRRFAAALRALSAEVVCSDAPGRAYEEVAAGLEDITRRLKDQPRRVRRVGSYESSRGRTGREFDYGIMDLSPLSGVANPLAAPMKVEYRQAERAVGVVRFPAHFGAGLGSVHNGFLVAVVDEVFGAVSTRMGRPVMTGILEVRFRAPCPVEKELRVEGWVRREGGQNVFTKARLEVGGREIAEADAVFFIVEEETYKRFSEERNKRAGDG